MNNGPAASILHTFSTGSCGQPLGRLGDIGFEDEAAFVGLGFPAIGILELEEMEGTAFGGGVLSAPAEETGLVDTLCPPRTGRFDLVEDVEGPVRCVPAITVRGTSRGVARMGIGPFGRPGGVSAVVFEFLTSLAWEIGVDVGVR